LRIAVFADVHGNIRALQAVLADIETRGVDFCYCAGDLVGYGAHPGEVIKLLGQKSIPVVMGNYDDGVGFNRLVCGCNYPNEQAQLWGEESIRWTKNNLDAREKEYLRQLPKEIRLEAGPCRILIVHGSPRMLNEYLFEDFPEEELQKILGNCEADGCGVDLLVCAHTHKAYHRQLGRGGHVINVGSVGKPKHGNPNALYAIVEVNCPLPPKPSLQDGRVGAAVGDTVKNLSEGAGAPKRDKFSVRSEFIEVPYEHNAEAEDIVRSGLPGHFAEVVRTGRG